MGSSLGWRERLFPVVRCALFVYLFTIYRLIAQAFSQFSISATTLPNTPVAVIVGDADVVVAFWDGESSGTNNTIELAREESKLLEVIECGY